MSRPDLNLLIALDVLLTEGSVVRAARRLRLSPSAMSRALARLRSTVGDPLLVRSGRGLVPTPRALALRERVGPLVQEVEATLTPAVPPDLARVARTFTVRASDGFVENYGPPLLRRLAREAPGVRLRFVQKTDGSSAMLREGEADLEMGVLSEATGPELRTQALFADRLVGVVRRGHPLARGRITPGRYAAALHVHVSRRGLDRGLVDEALQPLGLERRIVTVVTGFGAALALARHGDLVATVPERHTGNLRAGMHAFGLPVRTPEITVSMLWHPRLDADPVHRWLRGCVRDVCAGGDRRGARANRTSLPGPAAHSHSMVAGGLLEMS